jgi:uncharacterized protein YecE (DUF72 family)
MARNQVRPESQADRRSPNVRIGTSGWSYADWVGPFYTPGTNPGGYLQFYSRHFDIVEVDSTYYRVPPREMVARWAEQTPDGFQFVPKVPGMITHEKVLLDCEKDWREFTSALEPLGEKLHGVLLQFGYFNRKAFAGPREFVRRLETFLGMATGRTPIAVEIRNKHWLRGEYFDLLREHNASVALADHVWMPPIEQVLDTQDVRTGDSVYLRLIGDRKGIEEVTTAWDRVVVDRTERLRALAQRIRQIARRVPVVVFANNHYAGYAPATCRELRELVDTAD